MKRTLLILLVTIVTSCSSYHTVPQFYERHNVSKNKAYHMPIFKENVMDSLSPYTRNMLLDVMDLRYVELNESDINENELLKIEIKALFRKRFRDIQRVTKNDSIKIISMKVADNIAKELIVYFNKDLRNQVFYLSGDMDPNAIRDFIEVGDHRRLMNAMNPENFDEDDPNLKEIYRKLEEAKKKKKTE